MIRTDPDHNFRIPDHFSGNANSMNTKEYRFDLVSYLVRRNFILRYKGSALGVLWSLVPPLSQLAVLVFLFGKVVNLKIEAYPAFVLTGLLPWICLSRSLSSAGSIFIGSRDLVMRPTFEPYILVIVDTISNLLTYLLFLPILIVLLVSYDRILSASVLFFPLLLMIQIILTIGLGLIIATLNVFYRDVQQIVSVAVMLLFYLTPVFYQPTGIPGKYRILFDLNPIAGLIQNYRAIFFYGALPEWGPLLLAAVISCVLCGFGYFIYTRHLHDMFDLV